MLIKKDFCFNGYALLSNINFAVSVSNFGSGFFLTYKDLGRMFDHSFPACVLFLFLSGD